MEKENKNFSEEKKSWFENILELENEVKQDIALTVVEEGKLNSLYWFSLFLSAVIAALGLLQNSIPVVIGVMLIAPILRPIQAFSFGIMASNNAFAIKAFKNIILSILLVVVSSLIVAWMIPMELETQEILSRTNPNILDFFIAVFSAAIAFLALVYKKKLSMSIAGVAMAASLLPPLAVIGIEISYAHYFLAWNSFLLFLTNLVAIIFTGILLFFIFGFKPHQEEDKEKFKKNIIILLLLISLISLPLLASIINLNDKIQKEIFLENEIEQIFDTKKVSFEKIKIFKDDKRGILLEGKYFGDREDIQKIKNKIEILEKDWREKYKKEVEIKADLIFVERI